MDLALLSVLVVLVIVIIVVLIIGGVFIVKQWERTAVLRFGQIVRVAEPGLNFRIPLIESVYPVDMRMQPIRLDKQFTITKGQYFGWNRCCRVYEGRRSAEDYSRN
jgi:regulator of protease activity HflC (stomatin/prohibitin superfamily)